MKRLGLITLFVCVLTLPPMITLVAAAPGAGPFVVVHPPWVDGGAAVLEAGGQQIGLSDTKITTLAAAENPEVFLTRLQDHRVGLVLSLARLPFLCTDREARALPPSAPSPPFPEVTRL